MADRRAALTRAITALVDALLEAQPSGPCPRCGYAPGQSTAPAPVNTTPGLDPDSYLSRAALAARYEVPVKTVDQWAYKSYGPPYIMVGRYARYRVRDVLAWEAAQHGD